MSTHLCSIIVPVFQDTAILDLFLDSLWRTIEVPSQVILLNDGSGHAIDELIDSYVQRAPDSVQVERRSWPNTRGSAHALNVGIRLARGKAVVFADSDLILTDGWQTALLNAADHPNIGSVGALLMYPQTGGVQHCGIAFSEDIGRHLFLNSSPDSAPRDTFSVQSVVFALCAIPRLVTDAVGPIDEQYFNGYEDLDYQMRILKLGFQVAVEPRARAYHWERGNGPNRASNRKRNLGRFWRQWGNSIRSDLEDYLVRRLIEVGAQSSVFRGVDLCRDRPCATRIWEALKGEVSIRAIDDFSYSHLANDEIWLPQVLGVDWHRTSDRLLLLVDNFVQLLGNRYWIELRSLVRDDDLVIDLHANAVPLRCLHASCWPGTKLR